MDMHAMIRHYRKIFSNDCDVLDWIKHDLQHMGLSPQEIENYISNAKEHLTLEL